MPTPIWPVELRGGKLIFDAPAQFKAWIAGQCKPGRYRLILRRGTDKRGSRENRYYWGCVLEIFAAHVACEKEALHERLKEVIVPIGEANRIGVIPTESTATMTTGRFHWFVDQVRMLAAQDGCSIPDPNEVE